NELSHAFEVVGSREELVALGCIYPIIIRMSNRRRSDPEVHFFGAGIAHHVDNLTCRRATHDRVVHEDNMFAGDHSAIGGMIEAEDLVASCLGRLDSSTSIIVHATTA